MEWLIVLLCVLLIGMIPLGIRASYEQSVFHAWIVAGPFRFLLPLGKKKESKKNDGKKKDGFESHSQVKKKEDSLAKYLPLLQLVIDFLLDFRKKLRINELRFKAILGGGYPCDLSIHYGRAWAALGNILPLLEQCFTIKKRNLEIACDYTADSTFICGYIDMTVTVGQLLTMVAYHGFRVLRKYIHIMKKAKDGAVS